MLKLKSKKSRKLLFFPYFQIFLPVVHIFLKEFYFILFYYSRILCHMTFIFALYFQTLLDYLRLKKFIFKAILKFFIFKNLIPLNSQLFGTRPYTNPVSGKFILVPNIRVEKKSYHN